MSETGKYAIIGCGMMGREHMANLALVPGAELAAIVDPDSGSRVAAMAKAAQLGQSPEMYSDTDEMLRSAKPDAVIIASPLEISVFGSVVGVAALPASAIASVSIHIFISYSYRENLNRNIGSLFKSENFKHLFSATNIHRFRFHLFGIYICLISHVF